jgi:hypothetical protein
VPPAVEPAPVGPEPASADCRAAAKSVADEEPVEAVPRVPVGAAGAVAGPTRAAVSIIVWICPILDWISPIDTGSPPLVSARRTRLPSAGRPAG